MHRLENVLRAAVRVPWCIAPEKLDEVLAVLEMRANGDRATVEAIHAATVERRTPRAMLGGAIAVIPVHGVIAPRMNMMTEMSGGTSAEQLANQIRAAVENPQISAIVLDVDSPGGQAAGMSELSQKIRAWREQKYIVAVSNYMMGSAAYCIASAATEVVASPDSETGSIGTYAVHTDISQADAVAGIKRTLVKAGIFKAEEAPWFPLSDEAKAHMQETVDAYNLSFLTEVAANLGVSVDAVRNGFGQGRMLTAKAALAAGLVHRIATLDDVILELAGPGGPSARVAALAGARASGVIAPSNAATIDAPVVATVNADAEVPTDDGDADDNPDNYCPVCHATLDDGVCPDCKAKATAAAPIAEAAAPAPTATPDPLPIAASAITTTIEAGSPAATASSASGRGGSVPVIHIPVTNRATAPKAKETKVSDENTSAPEGADTNSREQELREISALATVHAVSDRLPKWIEQRTPLDGANGVRAEINSVLKERLAKGPTVKTHAVDLTSKEEQQYSYARAIASAAFGDACFERDVSEQISQNLPREYQPQGGKHALFMPTTIRAAGLDSITSTKGPELKFVQYGGFIDLLRNKARVIQAGGRMLSGLSGPVTFTKQNGAGSLSWLAENGGSDVSESNLLLTTVTLTAKTAQSTTSFSRQLLRQAVEDIEQIVRNDLAAVHALGIDLAALAGSGASNQPTGVFNQAGVGVVALGTNGLAPTYGSMINQQVQIGQANADEDIGAGAYITTPGIKGTLQTTQKFATTNGDPVWSDNDTVAGRKGFSTNQVQSNLTKGSSSGICHAIYYAIWQQLLIGEWGVMEILTDPLRLKKQGMIEVTSFEMIDIAVRYAGAFSVIKDALSAY